MESIGMARARRRSRAIRLSIAAASVLAKVHPGRMLVEFDSQIPGYGLASHKGYGSDEHRAARARLGPAAIKRKSFHPVAQSLFRSD